MNRDQQPAVTLFAIGMMGLGVLAFVVGDFAMQWQPVAPWFPARTFLAYGSGVLSLLCGAGLLFQRTVVWSARILFAYCCIWALLKVPSLAVAPGLEAVWLGAGEICVLLAGAWTPFARLGGATGWAAGDRGVRIARILFGVSLLPIGLSHLMYVKPTYDLVPAWMPFRAAWSYITGVGQMACGLGVLTGVLRRLAATAEAAQITLFTLLIWVPAAFQQPHVRVNWTALWISWAIAAAAWVVAQNTADSGRTLLN
ncbi:MAG TPA: DoxX family protein [Terracidiphilus sp.]|jgi:uncharacterized membrane protein